MTKRNVSRNLQMRVKRYLEYMHEEEKNGFQRAGNLISTLSKTLQTEIFHESYFKLLMEITVLKFNFSFEFIKELSEKMQEVVLAPNEILNKVFILYLLEFII